MDWQGGERADERSLGRGEGSEAIASAREEEESRWWVSGVIGEGYFWWEGRAR
jgi:hypothetical protein